MAIASQYVRGRKVIELVKRAVSGVPLIPPETEVVTPMPEAIGRTVTPTSQVVITTTTYTTKVT